MTKGRFKRPKVVLFDIGGVVVVSPFQAILDYELSLGVPPGWVNYSISKTAPDGSWHSLERGEIPMDAAFFEAFSRDLHDVQRWEAFYQTQQGKNASLAMKRRPVPRLDARWLFKEMMETSARPDPWMFPALKKLQASGKFIIAAVSNTVIFPPDHALHRVEGFWSGPVKALFDVFVSSAHVGLRKPDPKMYEFTLAKINEYAASLPNDKQRSLDVKDGIKPADVVFLDDIGENVKTAKGLGFRTIKVNLGKTFEAVEQLEDVTGLDLAGDGPRGPAGTRAKM